MKEAVSRGIQSVEVGANLLKVLLDAGTPLTLSELAKEADLTVPQAHAYMVSYRKDKMIERDARTGRYQPGPFALTLGAAMMRSFDPLRMASEAIADFSKAIHFTVALSVWGTHGPTVIAKHDGILPLYTMDPPGTVYSITGTATGRVYAAFLPKPVVKDANKQEISEKKLSRNVGSAVNLKSLKKALALIRYQGFATTNSTPLPHVNAIAAPVFDHAGHIQMVITVEGANNKLDVSAESPIITKLLQFTRYLSAQHGYDEASN